MPAPSLISAMRTLLMTGLTFALGCTRAESRDPWISVSDRNAELLTQVVSRYNPEQSADARHDTRILQVDERSQRAYRDDLGRLAVRYRLMESQADDADVRRDLRVLRQAASSLRRTSLDEEAFAIPYRDYAADVYAGVSVLLRPDVPPARRTAALARLFAYAGADGSPSLADVEESRVREAIATPAHRAFPIRAQVQNDIENEPVLVTSIEKLFRKYDIRGAEGALARFRKQSAAYRAFERGVVLPRARTNFRLPRALYIAALRSNGIDASPEDLIREGHARFAEQLQDVRKLAADVAKRDRLERSGYRDVIAHLKSRQLTNASVLSFYVDRERVIDAILRSTSIVQMPARQLSIRLATAAESASIPAPFYNPPTLVHNTGQSGEFVLPLSGRDGAKYDDFTYDAATWFLLAHEGYPGHALQFAHMAARGTSVARAVYAMNSANIEGWAVYAEWLMQPHVPLEGQLIANQFRLARIAYSFLDPELQTGRISIAQARHVLHDEVGLSIGYTNALIRRFTFLSPAQATSYYYGYAKLRRLRARIERRLGRRFNELGFNEAVLDQGVLPPDLVAQAVEARLR